MSDISGLSSRRALAFYDHHSSCWKTSVATFLSDSMSSSVTLPRSGMTRSGVLYERPMSERVTPGPGFSSPPGLLPTPRAADGSGSCRESVLGGQRPSGAKRSISLATALNHSLLLRTPQASVTEPKPGIKLAGRTPQDPQVGLIDRITVLLPSPQAQESNPTEEYVEEMRDNFDPAARMYLPGRKWFAQRTLSRVAALLPTPTQADGGTDKGSRGPDLARASRPGSGGDLVTAVDKLSSGEPTDQPSPEPPSSPAAQPLTLWTERDD